MNITTVRSSRRKRIKAAVIVIEVVVLLWLLGLLWRM